MNNVKVTKTPVPVVKPSEGGALRPFASFFPFPNLSLFRMNPFTMPFLDDFNTEWEKLLNRTNGAFLPAVECVVKDGQTVFTAELPGLKPEDVKVEVLDNIVSISGEKKAETEEKKEGYFRSERRYGTFFRTMPMPEGAKPEDIKAEIADGVLTVTIPTPAVPPPEPRKIPVEAAKA